MRLNRNLFFMKCLFVLSGILMISTLSIFPAKAQFIRGNAFELPVVGGEIAFQQLDTAASFLQEDYYGLAKNWLEQTFQTRKYQLDDPEKGQLNAEVHFKIDDQQIPQPLYYTALISFDFKDQVIRLNLHQLTFDKSAAKGKSKRDNRTDVTYQVKEQVRAGTDTMYPHTWDSLKNYGQGLLAEFRQYVAEASTQKL